MQVILQNENIPEGAKDLIKKLLCQNPEKRMKVVDIIYHPWLIKNSNDAKGQKKERVQHAALNFLQNEYDLSNENQLVSYNIIKRKYQMGKTKPLSRANQFMKIPAVSNFTISYSAQQRLPTPEARARPHLHLIVRPFSAHVTQNSSLKSESSDS